MITPGRKYSSGGEYRYGFNGKELDKEVAGTTTYDYGFRIYSPALGKFLSVDPLQEEYPFYTPYQFAGNTPIQATDLDGLEPAYHYEDGKGGIVNMPAGDNLQRKMPKEDLKYLPKATRDKVGERQMSLVLDLIPGIGQAKAFTEAVLGYDIVTGEKLSKGERGLNILPYVSKVKKAKTVLTVVKASDKAKDTKKIVKAVNKVDDVKTTEKAIIKKNSADGARREGEVTQELKDNGEVVLEQKYIYGPDGTVAKGLDGKGRRLDQVTVKDNKVDQVIETTSPTEAKRSRKIKQVERGDDIMNQGGTSVKGNNGESIPIPQGTKTKVETRQ